MEEKARRGTLSPSRERAHQAAEAPAGEPVPLFLVPARDYLGIAAQYCRDVADGREVAGLLVRQACARQVRDLARGALGWTYVWDEAEAAAACRFVESCPHVEGKWGDSPLIVLAPWQVFLVTCLYGWRRREDRTRRRFTVFFLGVGRKSAKSTLAATLALYHLLREGEVGASVVCAATSGSQARMVFGIMQKMGRRSHWLRRQGLEVLANSIIAPDGDARPVNSKASSLDGLNPSCIVLDESHAQAFGLHDVLKSAQGARPNPLLLCPTTAGYDLLSVGYALWQQASGVLQGTFTADHLLGVIYTLDEHDDWWDERVWRKALPMLGISPKINYMRQYALDVQQSRGQQGEFVVKECNRWASSASQWLSMVDWDDCADPTLRLEDFLGQRCWMGGDLAQVDDLAAIALLFERGDELVAFVRCYLPEGVVDQRAREVPAYREWSDDGLLVGTEGNMTDLDRIEADVRKDCQLFQVQEIVFDQYGSAQLAARLAASGLPAVVEPKTARVTTPPCRKLEAMVKHGKFRHDGNSLLKWAASNVVVSRRTDDTLLPKKVSAESPNKIDPIDALVSAIGAMLRGQQEQPKEYRMFILGATPMPPASSGAPA